MRLIIAILLISFSLTVSAQEGPTVSSLVEEMTQDSTLLRAIDFFTEWQRLEKESLRVGISPITNEQRGKIIREPHRAIEIYTSAGYLFPEEIAAAHTSASKANSDFMDKYKERLMELPGSERVQVVHELEKFKTKREKEGKE
jgi:hypothetical protein